MEITHEEELRIRETFDQLLQHCRKVYKSPEEDEAAITRAFQFACSAHRDSRRRSGEPYVMHSMSVARIVVCEIGLGVKSVMSALLHDVVNESDTTIEDIERSFGPKIASMVGGLTKLSGIVDSQNVSVQAENFKRLILTMSDDIRVVIIKIADRLDSMRTLQYLPRIKQDRVVAETMYLYAPLAHRIGLYAVKTELEDLSLKYLHPDRYEAIQGKIEETKGYRKLSAEKFLEPVRKRLDEKGYSYEITGRIKSVYSIWRKMETKQVPFEEIFDIYAVRIIFDPSEGISERDECFDIYHVLTDIYSIQKTDRLRNWVDYPKSNGYEALHCTVMDKDTGQWIEVQIRSKRMDGIAELGFAAHWSYKAKEVIKDNHDDDYEKWLSQLSGILNDPSGDAVEFIESFQNHLQVSGMTIFTPKGDVKVMPRKSTVLDFAYEIHSKIGDHAIGAKINYRLVSIYTELQPGDQVEVITSDSASPQQEWLSHVATAKARNHIRSFLMQSLEGERKQGRAMFEKYMADKSIKLNDRLFVKLLPAFGLSGREQFYVEVAREHITREQVYSALRSSTSTKSVKFWTLKLLTLGSYQGKDDRTRLEVASCCNPIPGDDVIGIKSGSSVTVHRKDCPEAISLCSKYGRDIVEVKWSGEKVLSYLTEVEFDGIDRRGVVMDLAKVIASDFNINMRDIEIHSHDGIYEGKISFYVQNQDSLSTVISKLASIRGLQHIGRKTDLQ